MALDYTGSWAMAMAPSFRSAHCAARILSRRLCAHRVAFRAATSSHSLRRRSAGEISVRSIGCALDAEHLFFRSHSAQFVQLVVWWTTPGAAVGMRDPRWSFPPQWSPPLGWWPWLVLAIAVCLLIATPLLDRKC